MTFALLFGVRSLIHFCLSLSRYEIRTNPSFIVTPQTTELYSSPANCRESVSHWAGIFPIETGDTCPVNQYYYSGFVALQALLDYTKIRVRNSPFHYSWISLIFSYSWIMFSLNFLCYLHLFFYQFALLVLSTQAIATKANGRASLIVMDLQHDIISSN